MKIGNNEVWTCERLFLDYAQHSCMYSRTLIVENLFLRLEIEQE